MPVKDSATARFAACAVHAHIHRQKNACDRKYGRMAISTITRNAVKPASTKRNSFNDQKEEIMGTGLTIDIYLVVIVRRASYLIVNPEYSLRNREFHLAAKPK